MISEYVLDHQSNSNFKLLLKNGKAIDKEELQEKKKDNIDNSLEEGEIENNNDNNNQKRKIIMMQDHLILHNHLIH